MSSLQKKSSHVEYLQEGEKVHGPSSSLPTNIIELGSYLEAEKMFQKKAAIVVLDMKSQVYEALRAL